MDNPQDVPLAQTLGWIGLHELYSHAQNPTAARSEPVNTATGNYFTAATDLSLPGVGLPFEFTRTYNSLDTTSGPLGPGWTHSYAASVAVQGNGDVVFRAEDGQRLLYTLQPDGSFKGAPGAHSTVSAVAGGYELVRHDQVRYRFDANGKLTELRDRNDNAVTLQYTNGLLGSITDTVGRTVTLTYDGSSLLTGLSSSDGREVSYQYTAGRLSSAVDGRGGVTRYTYDPGGRLATIVDANNHTVATNVYGSDGRIVSQTDARAKTSTFSWNPDTQVATFTDPAGNAWRDEYAANVLIRAIDPMGNARTVAYDRELNVVSSANGGGDVTWRTFDGRGNVLSVTEPGPTWGTTKFTYDAKNDVLTQTDDRGKTTSLEYDARANLVTVTRPGGSTTRFTRDSAGKVVGVTDPRGKNLSFAYDAAGNLTSITSPSGSVTSMSYDAAGRVVGLVEARGNVPGADPNDYKWTFGYDAAGNPTSGRDPLGNSVSATYDGVQNVLTSTDEKGRTTSYAYDPANHLSTVTGPGASVTSYEYDDAGNLARRRDPEGRSTSFDYDRLGNLTGVSSPTGQRWTYAFDPAGYISKIVDAAGNATPDPTDGTTFIEYDGVGRVVERSYSSGTTYSFRELAAVADVKYAEATPAVNNTYDGAGNRTSMTDGSGTETYEYDDLGRVTRIARGLSSFRYTYDAAGNVTRRIYPDGTSIDATYDGEGRLASVTADGATTTYTYDAAGNLTETQLPNGTVERRAYDRAGRLTSVETTKGGATLAFTTLTLDAGGNPITAIAPDGTTTYAYDERDRLTEACFSPGCSGGSDPFVRYSYDRVGNRLTETRASGTTTYTYNAADQLLSRVGPEGMDTFEYDPNGNLTRFNTRGFAYNGANQLALSTLGLLTTTYAYDGDGKRLRVAKGALTLGETEDSDTTHELWDPNAPLPQLALERNTQGDTLRRYVYGEEALSLKSGSSGPSYYHHDPLGSVVALTSSAGALQRTYAYEPFGALRAQTVPDPLAPQNPMRFTGALLDGTGLYHLRARRYDPGTGRFTQPDPVSPALTDPYVAAYVYANDRPTLLTDPSGECIFGKNPDGSCRGHSALMGKNVLKAVSIGGGVVAIFASGGTVVFIAGGISATAGGLFAAIECVDGGGFDASCNASIASAGLGVVGFGTGTFVTGPGARLLADVLGTSSITLGLAPIK